MNNIYTKTGFEFVFILIVDIDVYWLIRTCIYHQLIEEKTNNI